MQATARNHLLVPDCTVANWGASYHHPQLNDFTAALDVVRRGPRIMTLLPTCGKFERKSLFSISAPTAGRRSSAYAGAWLNARANPEPT
jgi:hypothetical protein